MVNAIAFAQGRVITGTVTSVENRMGVPGASVLVKGTTVGTTTDLNGKYSINVPTGKSVLVFRSVGLVAQEVNVGNRTIINLGLETDNTALNEVVVTGYGTQTKREVTGAVSLLKDLLFKTYHYNLLTVPYKDVRQGYKLDRLTVFQVVR
jgi:hypothetical protein